MNKTTTTMKNSKFLLVAIMTLLFACDSPTQKKEPNKDVKHEKFILMPYRIGHSVFFIKIPINEKPCDSTK